MAISTILFIIAGATIPPIGVCLLILASCGPNEQPAPWAKAVWWTAVMTMITTAPLALVLWFWGL